MAGRSKKIGPPGPPESPETLALNRAKFHADPSRNPESGRKVAPTGDVYKYLVGKYGAPPFPPERPSEAPPKIRETKPQTRLPARAKSPTMRLCPGELEGIPVSPRAGLAYDILHSIAKHLSKYADVLAYVHVSPLYRRAAYRAVTTISGLVIPEEFLTGFATLHRVEGILVVSSPAEAALRAKWMKEKCHRPLQMISPNGDTVLPVGWKAHDALAVSVASGDRKIIDFFAGLAKNKSDAMAEAAGSGSLELLKYVADIGLDWSSRAKSVRRAARGGHKHIIMYLLPILIDMEGMDEAGLEGAAEGGHPELIKFFTDFGAENWNRAYVAAVRGGHRDIITEFRKKANKTNAIKAKVILAAVANGDRNLIKKSIPPKGFKLDDRTTRPILEAAHIASRRGDIETLKMLNVFGTSWGSILSAASFWKREVLDKAYQEDVVSDHLRFLIAAHNGYRDIVSQAIGTSWEDSIEEAAEGGQLEFVEDFLKRSGGGAKFVERALIGATGGGRLDVGVFAARKYSELIVAGKGSRVFRDPHYRWSGPGEYDPILVATYAGDKDYAGAMIDYGLGVPASSVRHAESEGNTCMREYLLAKIASL